MERSIPRTLGTPTIGNLINNSTFMINVDLGWGKRESGNEGKSKTVFLAEVWERTGGSLIK